MCYDLYHQCKFCNSQYECSMPNYVCPTINRDANTNMCPQCEQKEKDAYKEAYEKNAIPDDKPISLEDWEK